MSTSVYYSTPTLILENTTGLQKPTLQQTHYDYQVYNSHSLHGIPHSTYYDNSMDYDRHSVNDIDLCVPQLMAVSPELEVPELQFHLHHGAAVGNTQHRQCEAPASWRQGNNTLPHSQQQKQYHTLPHIQHTLHGQYQTSEQCHTSATENSNKERKFRKSRTVFTPQELAVLEGVYSVNKFLNPALKADILTKISVPGNTVVMWFQNRRARDRATGIII